MTALPPRGRPYTFTPELLVHLASLPQPPDDADDDADADAEDIPLPSSRAPTNFLGIDPGLNGGVALLSHDGRVLSLAPTPRVLLASAARRKKRQGKKLKVAERTTYDVPLMLKLLLVVAPTVRRARLERLAAVPAMGAVGNFGYGRGYGLWEALLTASSVSFSVVASNVWKPALGLPAPDVPDIDPALTGKAKRIALGRRARALTQERKAIMFAFVAARWPDVDFTVDGKLHDGIAEAACVAEHLRLEVLAAA